MDNYNRILEKSHFELILFDMIGTTVQDTNQGKSIILDSFQNAFSNHQIRISRKSINKIRGKSKRVAIQELLEEINGNIDLVDNIYNEFLRLLQDNIECFQEIPGATVMFEKLNSAGIKIGIGSGLPRAFMDDLIELLRWDQSRFDFICSSEDLAFGRPNPIMIHKAINQLGISELNKVLKVGDTLMDVLEGRNANVRTCMVTSGSQTISDLGDSRPDFILESMTDLSKVIEGL